MSEMVSRVAEALIAEGHWNDDYESVEAWGERAALAAIRAMREPMSSMVGVVPYDMYEPDFAENWRTMIDEALR